VGEPLLHLVWNALDHGIEAPDARESAGKPRHGTLRIVAERDGDRVRILVEDDGRGLDLDALRARARSAGVVPAAAGLTDQEAEDLIFVPGLSTREGADTVSGRGLGLDVVRRSAEALRGDLHVERLLAGGTRFTMNLPLAVAVVPSLIFEAGGELLAVPAASVSRAIPLRGVERVGPTEVVRDGDRLVPVVDPDRLFRWPPVPRGGFGVLLRWGRGGALMTAQRLVQQRDLVVKAMPPYGQRPPGVSGASVLAGGRVILMLDPATVVRLASASGEEATA
jgi:two-component system, chemotaxis family, sensor kinase CheA